MQKTIIIQFHVYEIAARQLYSRERKQIGVCLGLVGMGVGESGWELSTNGLKKNFEGNGKILKQDCDNGYTSP